MVVSALGFGSNLQYLNYSLYKISGLFKKSMPRYRKLIMFVIINT